MKNAITSVTLALALIASPSVTAQVTLPTVTVIGTSAYGGGFGDGFNWPISTGGTGVPFDQYPIIVALVNQLNSLTDVRCTGGSFRNVTSQSDAVDRWMAAEQVFRAAKQTITVWKQLLGQNPFKGGIMSVTYADGGSEKYVITDPYFSAALGMAVPDSLVQKSGEVQPHGICG